MDKTIEKKLNELTDFIKEMVLINPTYPANGDDINQHTVTGDFDSDWLNFIQRHGVLNTYQFIEALKTNHSMERSHTIHNLEKISDKYDSNLFYSVTQLGYKDGLHPLTYQELNDKLKL